MPKSLLYILWAILFALCAALGFTPESQSAVKWLLVFLALSFYAPPGVLLWKAWQEKDKITVKRLLIISAGALLASLLTMVANLMSALSDSAVLGNILHGAWVILATPMACGRYWFLSLFLWAALLFAAVEALKALKKEG